MKKVVITGPTGAIGCAMIEIMLKQGYKIYAVCRPDSPNITLLNKHENLEVIECDISNLNNLSNFIKEDIDIFYHLAWDGTFGNDRNLIKNQMNNITYTLDAVKACKDLGGKVFVGAGSQAEYGHYNKPADESTVTKPFTMYGSAKLSSGHMSRLYAESLGIKHVWVRIFSVYGPKDDKRTLVSYLINELHSSNTPSLTKGEQVWDYVYSYDAADAMIKLGNKGKSGKVYCLGSGDKKLLKDYILEIRDIVNPGLELEFGDKEYSDNQIMFLSANISDLKNDVGFTPKYKFKDGISEILKTLN